MTNFYDNTRVACYKDCPRKYQLRHVLHLRGSGTSLPLVFGLCWHSAMEVVWGQAQQHSQEQLFELAKEAFNKTWVKEGLPLELSLEQVEAFKFRTPFVAYEMLKYYIEQNWQMLQCVEVLAIEAPFAVPLPYLENVWYVGRFDLVLKHKGQILVLDYKTTSEYKIDGGFKTSFLESWNSSSQIKGYEYAGKLFFKTDQVWINAVLVHAKVHNKFKFIPIMHGKETLVEWLENTKTWIEKLQADTSKQTFAMNEGHCFNQYGSCSYLPICSTCHNLTELIEPPEGYIIEKWEPFDEIELQTLIQGK
jgi:hypothetical protein